MPTVSRHSNGLSQFRTVSLFKKLKSCGLRRPDSGNRPEIKLFHCSAKQMAVIPLSARLVTSQECPILFHFILKQFFRPSLVRTANLMEASSVSWTGIFLKAKSQTVSLFQKLKRNRHKPAGRLVLLARLYVSLHHETDEKLAQPDFGNHVQASSSVSLIEILPKAESQTGSLFRKINYRNARRVRIMALS